MTNNNRSRFCLLAGTAFILLAASSRANPQGAALHVRSTFEEEQQQEIFEEDFVEITTRPPSSKDFSTQVWEGVIKQEANALEPSPSLDNDGEAMAMALAKKKKNRKKRNRRKKGMRKGTPKGGARKGGRRRRRQKKNKKRPIMDGDGDAQSSPMPRKNIPVPTPSDPARDTNIIPAPIAESDIPQQRPIPTPDPLPSPPLPPRAKNHQITVPRYDTPVAPTIVIPVIPTTIREGPAMPALPTTEPPNKPTT
ncbi:hypothetical protein BGZ93_000481, partial [Podila epicladia]